MYGLSEPCLFRANYWLKAIIRSVMNFSGYTHVDVEVNGWTEFQFCRVLKSRRSINPLRYGIYNWHSRVRGCGNCRQFFNGLPEKVYINTYLCCYGFY